MQEILVPWAAWYRETPFKMEFPDHWEVAVHHMEGGPDIGDEGIRRALQETIGCPAVARIRPRPCLRRLSWWTTSRAPHQRFGSCLTSLRSWLRPGLGPTR